MNGEKKTVLITGASSGIGLQSALTFFEKGWNVIATMRNPEERQTALHGKLPDLLHLDVTDNASIENALQYTLDHYSRLDVLVNNAGYAVYGPFEAATPTQIERQYQTNVFGLMNVIRQTLPVFRRQHSGAIVNVASMGGRIGFPLYSLYNSTKWAVDGFSEALQYELKPLNIRVKIIEPGVIETDFYDRSMDKSDYGDMNAYRDTVRRAQKASRRRGISAQVVARSIYRAATDESDRLRYVVGSDAALVSFLHWLLPERLFFRILENSTMD